MDPNRNYLIDGDKIPPRLQLLRAEETDDVHVRWTPRKPTENPAECRR